MRFYKKIVLLFLMLLIADKAFSQNDKSTEQRVIYEQQMSYDDARQMRAAVEQIEKQKKDAETDTEQINPIMNALNSNADDSDQNSNMMQMLKTLLGAMGIDNLNLEEGASDNNKASVIKESNFKTWEERHEWKGIRSEQR